MLSQGKCLLTDFIFPFNGPYFLVYLYVLYISVETDILDSIIWQI